jgi:hypothetical protein
MLSIAEQNVKDSEEEKKRKKQLFFKLLVLEMINRSKYNSIVETNVQEF